MASPEDTGTNEIKREAARSCSVAYILLHIPYPSETFVINEILALQDLGLTVFPIALFEAPKCHEHLVRRLKKKVLDLSHLDATMETFYNRFSADAERIADELSIPQRYAPLAAAVTEHVIQQGIHHLHGHFATEASIVALIVSALTGIPFSFTAHAYDLFNMNPRATGGLTLRERLALLLPSAAAVVTVSDFNKRYILDRSSNLGVEKIHIVRCGIDPQQFCPVNREARDSITFLSVGRLVDKKGHSYLLRAFKEAAKSAGGMRLRIVGEGFLGPELEKLTAELGISDRVEFLGAVSSEVVSQEMKEADAFVLHSITAESGDMEGVPVSLMEASATGLPVLSTRHSAIPELVLDGVTGFLTDEKDVKDFARRMVELASSCELRRRLGTEGRSIVQETYNLFTETAKLGDLFHKLSQRRRQRKLNVAFLTNILSDPTNGGGNVHVHQLTKNFLLRGHRLYTNLQDEGDAFIRWSDEEFRSRGREIDVFYIRIHGHADNDELTQYRTFNLNVPCIWEINAPLEELVATGATREEVEAMSRRRKELAHMVDAAICVSSEIEIYAQQSLGISRTFVLPNGSDPIQFSPTRKNTELFGGKFTVLWSGSAEYPWQGHRIVEEVARKMGHIDRDLLFVLTSEGKSEGNVRYLGRVPYEQMPEYMASADVGLCIYDEIDFYPAFFFSPLKLYDYMASGIPVIGSMVGQIASAVADYACGVVTDTTADDIVAKILYLKNNPAVAEALGANGRKAVLDQCNWESVVAGTEEVMNIVIREKQIKVSVVICTYNRAELLTESIKSIAAQDYPASAFEIIVVDNNSTDGTSEITESLAASSTVSIRYVFEERQGLSFARNTGIHTAHGEIVAFIDDDIDADRGWLAAIVGAFTDPSIACAGGPIRPIWAGARPEWLTKDLESYLTISEFDSARKAGEFIWPETPWGANISFRKSAFATVGLFPANLGRNGSCLLSGEEVNLCKRIFDAGQRIAFAPEAVIHHKIAPERTTQHWFFHRTYWQGRSCAVLDTESSARVMDGIAYHLKVFSDAARNNKLSRFSVECDRRIALGYLYQVVFAEGRDTRNNDLSIFRTLLNFLDQQAICETGAGLTRISDRPRGAAVTAPLGGVGILVVDYEVPHYDLYAGSRNTFMYLKLLAELGMRVWFLPDNFKRPERYSKALEDLGIEVLHGDWMRKHWQEWVMQNSDSLQYVFFNRPNITVKYLDFIKRNTQSIVVYQGHDLHYLRLTRKHIVDGDEAALKEAEQFKEIEFDIMAKSDVILTFSDYERQIICDTFKDKPVHTVPLFLYDRFQMETEPMTQRRDIMFVGSCGHKPNLDAIIWFARDIFPKVLEKIPDVVFHVIGADPPEQVQELASDNVRIVGHVSEEELDEFYRRIRMIVVPLRFGAGVKGKTVEALYKGIPLVSTTIGTEGIPGIDFIISPADDENDFADRIVSIYEDVDKLTLLSKLYSEFAKSKFSSEEAKEDLAMILRTASTTNPDTTASVADKQKLIAFFLPQYHPIPENDEWWGKGFTEWSNVTKAQPQFPGHYQPHLPSELGFYDLRLPEIRKAQAELAREHGIHGFCYYHYWFSGKLLLERPLHDMLNAKEPDFPFCLCWANEPWTRAWDGRSGHVLAEQHYGEEDDRSHIRYLSQFFRDPRYIRIKGKPLLLIYRANHMPDPVRTAQVMRDEARKTGIGEIYLCRVESFNNEHTDPGAIGFDAAVEFQPDWNRIGEKKSNPMFGDHAVYDYEEMANRMIAKERPPYKRFPCVTPAWDNSSRRKSNATIFVNSSPKVYEKWLFHAIRRSGIDNPDDRIVFINAWNEWGEGCHLEPDHLFGRSYLEATQRTLVLAGQQVDDNQAEQETVQRLQHRVNHLESELLERDRLFMELAAKAGEKERMLAEREERIQSLLDSLSWRVTGPLRWGYEKLCGSKSSECQEDQTEQI
jgi:glycosyltransferase involved in cell wall biosynthesis/GT2 family glycosyltransferase